MQVAGVVFARVGGRIGFGAVGAVVLSLLLVTSVLGAFAATVGSTGTPTFGPDSLGPSAGASHRLSVAVDGGAHADAAAASTASPPAYGVGSITATLGVGLYPFGDAYDAENGEIYVANSASGTVSVLSGSNNTLVQTVTVGAFPFGLAYDSETGDVYVTNAYSGTLSVISGSNDTVVQTIPVGGFPYGVAYDTGNGDLYVAVAGAFEGTVTVISGATNSVLATIAVAGDPFGVAYDGGSGEVYVANGAQAFITGADTLSTVSVISGTTNAVVATVPVGAAPLGVAYDSGTGDVYVTNEGSNNVSVIDGTTSTPVATVPIAYEPFGAVYDSANGDVYVTTDYSDAVDAISGTTNAVVAAVPAGALPAGAAYDSANGALYVADSGASTVSVISTMLAVGTLAPYLRGTSQAGSVVGTVPVGSGPTGTAYDPDSGDVDVANSVSGTVSVIHGETVTANVPVGVVPEGVAYDSGNGEVYVADNESDAVSVLSGTTNATLTSVSLPTGSDPIGVTYDSGNGEVYVADDGLGLVSVIDGATNTVVAEVPVGADPYGLAYDAGTGEVYVSNSGGDTVSLIDGLSNTVTATVPVGTLPAGLVYDGGNGEIYVANRGTNNLSVLSGETVLASIPVGGNPTGVAYDSANGGIYVANEGTSNVSVVNGTGNTVVANLAVGGIPSGVAYDSGTGDVYAANDGSNSVSVISTLTSLSYGNGPGGDPGQEILLSAPLLGGGAGGDSVAVRVSPASGLTCVTDPPGYGEVSGACAATAAGNFTVTFTVQDAVGDVVWTSVPVLVSSDPTVESLTAAPTSVDLGQSTVLTAAVSGGSGGYVYGWSGLPPGCTGADVPVLDCQPNASSEPPVTMTVTVSVTDSNGYPVTASTHLSIEGVPALSQPTVTVNGTASSRADEGQALVFATTQTTRGTGLVSLAWVGLPPGCGGTTETVSCSATVPGTYLVSAWGVDANGVEASSSPTILEVTPDPAVGSPVATPGALPLGDPITLVTTASGGAAPYTYAWTGLPAGCVSANASEMACTPTAAGTYAVRVSVTDALGTHATSSAVAVTVTAPASHGSSGGTNDLEWTTLGLAAVAVALGVAALAVLGWRRKGRGGTNGPTPRSSSSAEPGSGAPKEPGAPSP